jgi:uncharacterized protein YcbK (DUF882 family)
MGDLSAHFSRSEFACKHCGQVSVSPLLIDVLEDIRAFAGIPLVITSGYRCPEHNAAVSGGSTTGAHITGEAADIFVSGSLDRFKLLEAIVMCQVRRYGIGADFVHVDVSQQLAQDVTWVYGGKE